MKRNNIIYDVCICIDDEISNMVEVCDTIEEASNYIGCTTSALYKNMQLYGVMKANGYIVELVERVD